MMRRMMMMMMMVFRVVVMMRAVRVDLLIRIWDRCLRLPLSVVTHHKEDVREQAS